MTANMPKEMEAEFRLIQHELFTIIAKWRSFVELYGTESHVDLLNNAAPVFFRIVQDIFVDDVILSILRLLDPAKSMGNDNLSIAHLIDHLAQSGVGALHAEVTSLHSDIRKDSERLIKIRNKLLAHNDLSEKQNRSASLYAGVTKNLIDKQIQSLCSLMNRIHSSLSDTETYYESACDLPDGSPALLDALRTLEQVKKRKVGA
jgi:hypothetical protein